jgi:prophage regulatory protein
MTGLNRLPGAARGGIRGKHACRWSARLPAFKSEVDAYQQCATTKIAEGVAKMKASVSVQQTRLDGPGNPHGSFHPKPYGPTIAAGGPKRMLRLRCVLDITGLGKTTIYQLQADGNFPMRVQLTAHSVAWVEEEVLAWLARRADARVT